MSEYLLDVRIEKESQTELAHKPRDINSNDITRNLLSLIFCSISSYNHVVCSPIQLLARIFSRPNTRVTPWLNVLLVLHSVLYFIVYLLTTRLRKKYDTSRYINSDRSKQDLSTTSNQQR